MRGIEPSNKVWLWQAFMKVSVLWKAIAVFSDQMWFYSVV